VSSDVEPLRIKPQAKTKERMQYIKDGLLVKDIHTFSDHTVVYHYTEEVISNVKIPVVFYKWISKDTEFNYYYREDTLEYLTVKRWKNHHLNGWCFSNPDFDTFHKIPSGYYGDLLRVK